jgi:hypothetical protein
VLASRTGLPVTATEVGPFGDEIAIVVTHDGGQHDVPGRHSPEPLPNFHQVSGSTPLRASILRTEPFTHKTR